MRSNGNGIFAWPSLPAVPIPGGIQEIPNPTIPSPIKNEIEKDDEEEDKDGSIELEGNDWIKMPSTICFFASFDVTVFYSYY